MKSLKYFMCLFFLVLFSDNQNESLCSENNYDIIDFEKVIYSGKGSVTFEMGVVDTDGNFIKGVIFSKDGRGGTTKYAINQIKFAFSKDKFWIQNTELIPDPKKNGERTFSEVTEKAFDGKIIQVLKPSSGYIDNPELFPDRYDPRKYFFIGNQTISGFINGLKNKTGSYHLKSLENKIIDNYNCIVYNVYNDKEGKSYIISIPENHLYIPKKIEITDEKQKSNKVTNFILKEYPYGILFPEKIVSENYKITGENKKLFTKGVVTFGDDFRINMEIPAQTFSIDFPDNFKITDNRFENIK